MEEIGEGVTDAVKLHNAEKRTVGAGWRLGKGRDAACCWVAGCGQRRVGRVLARRLGRGSAAGSSVGVGCSGRGAARLVARGRERLGAASVAGRAGERRGEGRAWVGERSGGAQGWRRWLGTGGRGGGWVRAAGGGAAITWALVGLMVRV
jgi:hypothetical protein